MNNIHYLEKEDLFPIVLTKLKNVAVLLDIGCGIMPQRYVQAKVHICCEPFKQYVEHLQQKVKNDKSDKNYVIINTTWNDLIKIIPNQSVDSIFLVDVVEHLEKKEALDLINQSIDKVRKQIAIFTPLGFLPQYHPDGKDAWGLDGGAWQEHKSGWQPDDFDSTWDVYVAKVFHTTDNLGKKFDTPYGALWAIKNIPQKIEFDNQAQTKENTLNKKASSTTSNRKTIHDFVDRTIDLVNKLRK